MVGGKQHCESTGTSNKRVAKKILAIRLAAIAEGRFSGLLKSHAPTLKNYLSKYLDSRTDLQPNTRTPYAVSRRSSGKLLWRHSASRHHGCPNRGIQGSSNPSRVRARRCEAWLVALEIAIEAGTKGPLQLLRVRSKTASIFFPRNKQEFGHGRSHTRKSSSCWR